MSNAKGKASPSLLQQVILAAAPGGVLTRRSTYFGLAGGLLALIVGLMLLVQLRAHANDPAAIRLSDARLMRLPTRSVVSDSPALGHGETRQYGVLDDPNLDATVVLIIPPAGQSVARDFVQEVRGLELVGSAERVAMARSYELQTRFGTYQATELQVDMIGRWKDCVAFLSRFATPAVYVKGWYCDDIGKKPKADRVACALDGLALDHSLTSANADAFMREHIARPSFCGAIDRGENREVRSLSGAN
jgi:hypothetical protein